MQVIVTPLYYDLMLKGREVCDANDFYLTVLHNKRDMATVGQMTEQSLQDCSKVM